GIDRCWCRSLERARELWVRLGLLGDAVRVDDVALALVAASSTTSGAVRPHVTDIEAVVDEKPAEVAPEARRVLDTPPLHGAVVVGPCNRFGVAGDVVVEVLGRHDRTAFVEDRGGEASPVWIDADDVASSHELSPSSRRVRRSRATTSQCRAADALIKSARFPVTVPGSTLQTPDAPRGPSR